MCEAEGQVCAWDVICIGECVHTVELYGRMFT